ncbi:MAG: LCP family protein [Actinobacteria bacterium]|nr:LCP family protein [Actinomycetota bacterium]MBW3647805.1 LCP family protein [Actinomycetota bacterium]
MDGPTNRKDAADEPPPDRSNRAPKPLPAHLDPRGSRGRQSTAPAAAPTPSIRPTTVPADPPRRRRRRRRRILSWIAVITSVAVLATVGAGYALINHYDRNLNRIEVFGAGERPEPAPRDAKNILIVGSDSRGDDPDAEFQGTGKDFVAGQRSDVIILAHLYGGNDKAQLVSFPRDLFVSIPEHVAPDSGKRVPAREDRINAAFSLGGPPLLIETIEKLTDLRIDNYLQIDFAGFQSMVNTLGGVEVCLSKPAKDAESGIDLPAGRSVVQGEQALAFVRQRNGLPRGDLDRIARQQQFIGAIVRKTLSAGTLLNPLKLNGVISAATDSVQIDRDLSFGELRDLALRFRSFDAGGVIFVTVPVGKDTRIQGKAVIPLDDRKAAELFDQLDRDIPPGVPLAPPGAEPGQRLVVAPGSVRVKVSNGAGVQGLGRRAYDDLAAVGFQLVGEPGNRAGSADQTVVFHGPDKADSARTLVAALPGATAKLDPSLTRTLEVVVGSRYAGAEPVTVSGAPPPAAPAPEVKTAAQDPCAT